MANGNIYVFNATPTTVQLFLNDHNLIGSLAGVQQASSYAPNSVSAPRNPAAGNPSVPQFGGMNSLIVSFPNGGSQSYPVKIDPNNPQYPLQYDLQLYIFFNEVILVSPSGSAALAGSSLSAAQMTLLQAAKK